MRRRPGLSVPGMPKIDLKGSKVQGHWKRGLDSGIPGRSSPCRTSPASSYRRADLSDRTVGSIPCLTACRFGMFDTAQVQVDRAYFANPLQPPLTVALRTPGAIVEKVFFGVVGTVDWNDTTSVFTINDFKYLMKTQMPRNLFQGECRHQLFDAGCTLNAATYAQSGTVLAGCTQSLILATPPAPTGATSYRGGRIVFTSGQNNGFQATIQAWDGIQSFQMLTPLPSAPTGPATPSTSIPAATSRLASAGMRHARRLQSTYRDFSARWSHVLPPLPKSNSVR